MDEHRRNGYQQRPVDLHLLASPINTETTQLTSVMTETVSSLGPYVQNAQQQPRTRVRNQNVGTKIQREKEKLSTASAIVNPASSIFTRTFKSGIEKFLSRHIDDLFDSGKIALDSQIEDLDDIDFVFIVRRNGGRSLSFRFAAWLSRVLGREQVTEKDLMSSRERYLNGLKNIYKISYRKISTPEYDFYPIKFSFYHLGLMMQLVGYSWRLKTSIEEKVAYKTFYFLKRDIERYHEYQNCRRREDFSARWRYDLAYNFLVGAKVPLGSVNPWRSLLKHRASQASMHPTADVDGEITSAEDLEKANAAKEKQYTLLHLFADELFDDWLVPHSSIRERTVDDVNNVVEDIKETGTTSEKISATCCFPCWTCQLKEAKEGRLSDRAAEDQNGSACGSEITNSWRSWFFRNSVDCMDIHQRPHENIREFLARIATIRNATTKHSFPSPPEEMAAKIRHILPLKTLVDYLGEKIGFYFGWVELLILSLSFPSVIGALMFICGVIYYSWNILWGPEKNDPKSDPVMWVLAKSCDNYATPGFSAIMVIWGTAFYEVWQRREKWYAYLWHVEKLENTELERPPTYSFKATAKLRRSRILRPIVYLPSFLITFLFIVLVFVSVYFINVIGVFSIPYCPKDQPPISATTSQNSTGLYTTSTTSGNFSSNFSSSTTTTKLTTTTLTYVALMLASSTQSSPEVKVDKFVCNMFSAVQVIANSISIFVLDFIYTRVCYLLTDWEGHKTQSTYTDALVFKLFTFRFFNYYTVLFYIAFGIATNIVQYPKELTGGTEYDYEKFGCGEQPCMAMLSRQLLSVIVTQPLINSLYDVIMPALKYMYLAIKHRVPAKATKTGRSNVAMENSEYDTTSPVNGESRESTSVDQFDGSPLAIELEKQANLTELSTLDRREFTTEEYTEKVIVYGALLMFSVALPPAPALAILIMRIDLNLDIGRIMSDFRRPIPLRSQNIGMWGPIVNFLTYLGILTNPLIVILTSSWGKDLELHNKFLIFLGFEHIVFAIRMLVSFAVPDVPKKLVREQLIHKNTKDELQSILLDAKIEQAGASSKGKRRLHTQSLDPIPSPGAISRLANAGFKLDPLNEIPVPSTSNVHSKESNT